MKKQENKGSPKNEKKLTLIQNMKSKDVSPRIKLKQQSLFYEQRYSKLEIQYSDQIKQYEYNEKLLKERIQDIDSKW